jgi:hypothetical protein
MFHNYGSEDDRFMTNWFALHTVKAPDAQVTLDDLLEAFNKSMAANDYPPMGEDDFRVVMRQDHPEIRLEVRGLRKQLVYLGLRLRSTPSRPPEEMAREKGQVTAVQDAWLLDMRDAVRASDQSRAIGLAQRMIRMKAGWTKRANQTDKEG